MTRQKTFTGRARRLTNRASVKIADTVARIVITVAGIGSIFAVSTVFLFLLWVAFPLVRPGAIGAPEIHDGPPTLWSALEADDAIRHGVGDGRFFAVAARSNETLLELDIGSNGLPTSVARVESDVDYRAKHKGVFEYALGYADGTVRLLNVVAKSDFPPVADLPAAVVATKPGEAMVVDGAVFLRPANGPIRRQTVSASLGEPTLFATGPIERLSATRGDEQGTILAIVGKQLILGRLTTETNALDEVVESFETFDLTPRIGGLEPRIALALSRGREVVVASKSGHVMRLDVKRPNASDPPLDELDALTDPKAELTCATLLPGERTFVLGDSTGRVSAWFATRVKENGEERSVLRRVHTLPSTLQNVAALGHSPTSRVLAVADDKGQFEFFHVTTATRLAAAKLADGPPSQIAIAEHDSRFAWSQGGKVGAADLHIPHPEASLTGLFSTVWYEGDPEPSYFWQASASDGAEPKFSLIPLIFGTLKATFYAMLFAAPLALMAAIYSSEFLRPSVKQRVKPVIEMMASLPSVVLGYLAAIVFAPIVERDIARFLTALGCVPLCLLIGAQIWTIVPTRWSLQAQRLKLLFVALALLVGLALAWLVGPLVESVMFHGDFKAWLNHERGGPFPGWVLLSLPLSLTLALFLTPSLVSRVLGSRFEDLSGDTFAWIEFARLLATVALGVGLACGVAWVLTSIGWDSRGGVLDRYEQRNALIVGVVMGFAVVPLIYTIADDALATVPQHLRSASLGAGATPWQTAVRVVIPTAMSGLFSALMIGLGRAVGETMIVVMATGNSPIMKSNAFNGLRTLSATLAIELGDSAAGGTHYRTLFLAALVLFCMTFVVNTVAELVRIRFRKRAHQL